MCVYRVLEGFYQGKSRSYESTTKRSKTYNKRGLKKISLKSSKDGHRLKMFKEPQTQTSLKNKYKHVERNQKST